jgi:preprotein translocase SecE subunit
MTDRKRNAGRSQVAEPKTTGQIQVEKSDKLTTRDERRTTKTAVKTSEVAPPPVKGTKTTTPRDERKSSKSDGKSTNRRDTRGNNSIATRWRNNRVGRFIYDAYYELRYKVTWPTTREALNMTVAVLVICAILGAILSLFDLGLYNLFIKLIGS